MLDDIPDLTPGIVGITGYKVGITGFEALVPVDGAVAGKDESGPATGRPSCQHIDAPVTDHKRTCERDSVFPACLLQHPRFWFPARARFPVRRLPVVGMMGAEVDRIDPGAFVRKHGKQSTMNGRQIGFSKQSAGNTGLVRNNKDLDSEFVRLSYGPGGIWDELKLFRTGEEIQLGVQSAITVKEKSNLINLHALIA